MHPECIKKMIRRCDDKPGFEVRLWKYSHSKTQEWVYVDETFPPETVSNFRKGGLKYFWSAIIEKALAKMYGGYDAMVAGDTSHSLFLITGEMCSRVDLNEAKAKTWCQKIGRNASDFQRKISEYLND